jgi:hypothetical protein
VMGAARLRSAPSVVVRPVSRSTTLRSGRSASGRQARLSRLLGIPRPRQVVQRDVRLPLVQPRRGRTQRG